MLPPLLLVACSGEEDFDARFDRERQAIERQGAEIENSVDNQMAAAREAERARAESEQNDATQ